MALCRCSELHSNPKGYKNSYIISKRPVGYPQSSSICGRNGCQNPGLIWLTKEEEKMYRDGERVFSFKSAVSKVKIL